MGVKVKGVSQAKKRLDSIFGEVEGRKIGRAIKSATLIIAADAATMTPIDTSFLVNSQYQDMIVGNGFVRGIIGYMANYAAAVHESKGLGKGRPRANGNGNYWDPSGEPKFLEKSAKANKEKVTEIMRKELSL